MLYMLKIPECWFPGTFDYLVRAVPCSLSLLGSRCLFLSYLFVSYFLFAARAHSTPQFHSHQLWHICVMLAAYAHYVVCPRVSILTCSHVSLLLLTPPRVQCVLNMSHFRRDNICET